MKTAILVLTDQGLIIAQRIAEKYAQEMMCEIWLHTNCQGKSGNLSGGTKVSSHVFQELKGILPALWKDCSLLIFIMASGIVVRHIAPLLQSKAVDPAVLVLDEKGEFVIPLLSGHLGGANAWAREIAKRIGGEPVLTTATDVRGLTAPDEYARRLGWRVEPLERLHRANRFLLDHEYLCVWSDFELPEEHPIKQDKHYRFLTEENKNNAHIWISVYEKNLSLAVGEDGRSSDFEGTPLLLIPRVFSIGVGCRRETSGERIIEAVNAGLKQIGVSPKSVLGIYSIDLKANELGIHETARILGVPFQTFSAEKIQAVNEERRLTPSSYVREKIGVDGVCEATSLLGTKQGELVLPKQKLTGVTVAISQERFLL